MILLLGSSNIGFRLQNLEKNQNKQIRKKNYVRSIIQPPNKELSKQHVLIFSYRWKYSGEAEILHSARANEKHAWSPECRLSIFVRSWQPWTTISLCFATSWCVIKSIRSSFGQAPFGDWLDPPQEKNISNSLYAVSTIAAKQAENLLSQN